jgi:hypothetical protein
MVLENVKVGFTGKVSDGVSRFGLFVLSCLFGLCSRDGNHFAGVCFLGERASGCYHKCPMYKLSITSNMSFSCVELENGCWFN